MAKKYCHKDSFTNTNGTGLVDEVRVRNGTNAAIPFNQIASTIQNLAIPVDRGSPSVALTANNSPYTIPKGKYTGGSVSVTAQSKEAQLSANGGTIYPDSGKVLSSVTIPAKNVYSYKISTFTPTTDNSTSISITGLTFAPIGVVVVNTFANYKNGDNAIAGIYCTRDNSGNITELKGFFPDKSAYLGSLTGATVTFGNNSVTIGNVTGIRNGTTFNGVFRNNECAYFVWG